MRRKYLTLPLVVLALVTVQGERPRATTVNYCTAADPNDNVDDYDELQNCLDGGGEIYLSAGSPGYIVGEIGSGLEITIAGTELWSDPNNRATIKAHPDLDRPLLRAYPNSWKVKHLIFDGNKFNRTATSCTYPNGHNLQVDGNYWEIAFIDSSHAMCGSALEAKGEGFEIYNSVFAYNGWAENEATGWWADGLTIHRCTDGYIHDNDVAENTDVGIVIFRGVGCTVRWNTISNYNRQIFGGMDIGASDDGYHTNSVFSDNEIYSGYDLMRAGLVVGMHAWTPSSRTEDAGTVEYNHIEGAVINLMVDGVDAGTVTNNAMYSPQGTRGLGTCYGLSAINFISDHNGGSLTLQSGSTTRHCHN